MKFFRKIASIEPNDNQHNVFDLDEDDIDRIQEILDESDEENVEILFDNENDFPQPIKPTQKNVN